MLTTSTPVLVGFIQQIILNADVARAQTHCVGALNCSVGQSDEQC